MEDDKVRYREDRVGDARVMYRTCRSKRLKAGGFRTHRPLLPSRQAVCILVLAKLCFRISGSTARPKAKQHHGIRPKQVQQKQHEPHKQHEQQLQQLRKHMMLQQELKQRRQQALHQEDP